jgi:hypothetical protein
MSFRLIIPFSSCFLLYRTAAPCIVIPLQECHLSLETSSSTSPTHISSHQLSHLPSDSFPSFSPPAFFSSPLLSLPSVERGISSSSHHSTDLNHRDRDHGGGLASGDTDHLPWSLKSPPPPNYLQLPNCPICLRRLINRVSQINDDTSDERNKDKLIIGPGFIGHGDRCRVCHIYSDTSSLVQLLSLSASLPSYTPSRSSDVLLLVEDL